MAVFYSVIVLEAVIRGRADGGRQKREPVCLFPELYLACPAQTAEHMVCKASSRFLELGSFWWQCVTLRQPWELQGTLRLLSACELGASTEGGASALRMEDTCSSEPSCGAVASVPASGQPCSQRGPSWWGRLARR